MRVSAKLALLAVGLIAASAPPAFANTERTGQTVAQVLIDSRPCMFFNLANVSEADPVAAGQKWFAIPVSNANYQTYASIVLSSRLTRQPFWVQTDGTISCGFATASLVGFS